MFIPEHKRLLVMPVVEDIIERVWARVEREETTQVETRKNLGRLKVQYEARQDRVNTLATVISMKEYL